MKMVKSLLLGSAAGLVAVAGAQAADLPVKAAPVEYVKICSAYGEGFFYIPGTDTCLKIGGYVRWEMWVGAAGSHSPYITTGGGFQDRGNTFDYQMRTRFAISADVRTQTDYGTLRAYIRIGAEETTNATDGGAGAFYAEKGFIQFAGFTAGKTQSYFDFFQGVFSYGGIYLGGGSETILQSPNLFAYTAQLGNGISFTLSAEDNTYRRNAIWDATDRVNALNLGALPGPDGTAFFSGNGALCVGNPAVLTNDAGVANIVGCTTGDYAGTQAPDIVGSLRVDQAWGTAQIAGALHQLRANFYGNDTLTGNATYTGIAPTDRWGWAAMAGVVVNLPWSTCCGDKVYDRFWIEGAYSEGVPSYNGFATSEGHDPFVVRFQGSHVAAGWALDAIFANNPLTPFSGLVLPSTWDVAAAIEHHWTPSLRTSVFSSYALWDPGTQGNQIMCSSTGSPVRTNTMVPTAPNGTAALPGCDFKFAVWGVGTRTIWNPVKNLELGVEVMYSKIEQNMDPHLILFNFRGDRDRAAGFYSPASEDSWSGTVRAIRYFYP